MAATEYFIVANRVAAPFVSDQSMRHVVGDSSTDAMEQFVARYSHPAGLYAADVYASADAYHKGQPALVEWRCNQAQRIAETITQVGAVSVYNDTVDGKVVNNRKAGRITKIA